MAYVGFGWAEAVHPDDRAASVESWNAAVAERRRYTHEHRVRRHDGVFRIYAIQAVPVLDPDGAALGHRGVPALDAGSAVVRVNRLGPAEPDILLRRIQAVPVLDPDGAIREWVGVHSDITEQRTAEAALRIRRGRHRSATPPAVRRGRCGCRPGSPRSRS
jgi:PAS domain-containing protein